jgi:copper(I)-binding protein
VRVAFAAAILIAALGASACGGGDDDALAVHDVWARSTPAVVSVGAVYLRVTSPVDDELVGAGVDPSVADSVQLHDTEMDAAGTATMTEQMSMAVPAGGELVLDPLGSHLMLVGLVAPLIDGSHFDITLQFATAGAVTAEVAVSDTEP